ncbi:MerR family transcriptional regulator [Actinokineospora bangkokensis]|uniref:MerR family transcriptional regulator n=1 Tax=Actinokineospora bangkokensis TaxID=1193682 RepID=A0A1Q9LL16_9PSEU|nr:MerR family transcriptional regulator [Actinokineospora bangkokensis]OLR92693.1 MerR family transcriptional regulator [Actinokineospora bangkokensis]
MRIGELAARTGVSVRSLRYYEEQQLLAPVRSGSGQRHYPESAVARVRYIQELYSAGLGSKAVLEIMPCVLAGQADPALLEKLIAQRDRIADQVAELTATRDRLDMIIETTRKYTGTGEVCRNPLNTPGHPHESCFPPKEPDTAARMA